jgi:hypothetical protein
MKNILFILLFTFAITVVNAQPPGVRFDYVYPYKNGIPKSRFKERRDNILSTFSTKSLILSFQLMCETDKMMWTMSIGKIVIFGI